MPELPEVEVVRAALHGLLAGDVLVHITLRSERLRYPLAHTSLQLQTQRLLRITRRAKYMLWHFDAASYALHLGMSGRVRVVDPLEPWLKHEHIQWQFRRHTVRLCDPRRFGFWVEYTPHWQEKLAQYGPEPLDHWDVAQWYMRHRASPRGIYRMLMDQRSIAGLGNIYVQEALFHSKVHPQRRMQSLEEHTVQTIASCIIRVLTQAIAQGGTTLQDHRLIQGSKGYFQVQLAVYARALQPCYVCATPIDALRIAQRTVSFCPTCQVDT